MGSSIQWKPFLQTVCKRSNGRASNWPHCHIGGSWVDLLTQSMSLGATSKVCEKRWKGLTCGVCTNRENREFSRILKILRENSVPVCFHQGKLAAILFKGKGSCGSAGLSDGEDVLFRFYEAYPLHSHCWPPALCCLVTVQAKQQKALLLFKF